MVVVGSERSRVRKTYGEEREVLGERGRKKGEGGRGKGVTCISKSRLEKDTLEQYEKKWVWERVLTGVGDGVCTYRHVCG
jgi:hypothetical protein